MTGLRSRNGPAKARVSNHAAGRKSPQPLRPKSNHEAGLFARHYSALMPPRRITSPQRVRSIAIKAEKSSGLPSGRSAP